MPGHGGEDVAVHPVVEVEVTGNPVPVYSGSGQVLLALAEEVEAPPAGGMAAVAAALEGHHRPRRLRGGADPDPAKLSSS